MVAIPWFSHFHFPLWIWRGISKRFKFERLQCSQWSYNPPHTLATTTFSLPGAGPARWEEGNRVCWTVYFSSDSVLDVCYQKNNLLSSFAPSNSTPCRLGASVGRSASALLDRKKQRHRRPKNRRPKKTRQLCSTSSSRFRSQLSRAHLLINEQMNKALNEWINA